MKDKRFTICDPFTGKREYICHAEKDCALCKHCYDVYWDYTNGPYMFFCNLGEPSEDKHYCNKFEEEENPIYGNPDMCVSDETIKKIIDNTVVTDEYDNKFFEELIKRIGKTYNRGENK